jgi:hypothetical protein
MIATLAGDGEGVECCDEIVVAMVAGEAGSDCFWRLVRWEDEGGGVETEVTVEALLELLLLLLLGTMA